MLNINWFNFDTNVLQITVSSKRQVNKFINNMEANYLSQVYYEAACPLLVKICRNSVILEMTQFTC